MVSREIWIYMRSINIEVFEKLTRACYIQIALETMLLPILIINLKFVHLRLFDILHDFLIICILSIDSDSIVQCISY
jgi:hypothetical protein